MRRASPPAMASVLLRAGHPLPSAAVTTLVGALAVAWGRGPWGVLLVVLAVGAGQLSVGWCNDAVDAARDRSVGRRDKPVATGAVSPQVAAGAAGLGLAACVVLSLANGVLAGTVHLTGVAAAWAYDLGLKSTAWSWLPYAVGFGSLPAFVILGLPGTPAPAWWVVVAGALLGVGAHAANVLPDLADDAQTGVRGLPHRLGPTGARVLSVGGLTAAVALLALAPPGPPGPLSLAALVAVLALAAWGVRPGVGAGDRGAFRATIAAAAVAVGLLLTLPAPIG
jgi:4-hydroxybenzoate polyprenyltransferase